MAGAFERGGPMTAPLPHISRRDPEIVELAVTLARGYLRLTEKAPTSATITTEKRLDLRAEESVTVVQESRRRRP